MLGELFEIPGNFAVISLVQFSVSQSKSEHTVKVSKKD